MSRAHRKAPDGDRDGVFYRETVQIVAGDLTWYEVHVALGDGGASCHRQVGESRVKSQVTCNKDLFSHQLMAAS